MSIIKPGIMGFLKSAWTLIAIWWNGDRVRIKKSDGSLLRVPVGQRLMILGRVWLVRERRELSLTNQAQLELQLEDLGDGTHAAIRIRLGLDDNGRIDSKPIEFMKGELVGSIEYDDVILLKSVRP